MTTIVEMKTSRMETIERKRITLRRTQVRPRTGAGAGLSSSVRGDMKVEVGRVAKVGSPGESEKREG